MDLHDEIIKISNSIIALKEAFDKVEFCKLDDNHISLSTNDFAEIVSLIIGLPIYNEEYINDAENIFDSLVGEGYDDDGDFFWDNV